MKIAAHMLALALAASSSLASAQTTAPASAPRAMPPQPSTQSSPSTPPTHPGSKTTGDAPQGSPTLPPTHPATQSGAHTPGKPMTKAQRDEAHTEARKSCAKMPAADRGTCEERARIEHMPHRDSMGAKPSMGAASKSNMP